MLSHLNVGKIGNKKNPPSLSIFCPVGGEFLHCFGEQLFDTVISSFPIFPHIETRETDPYPLYFFPFPLLPFKIL